MTPKAGFERSFGRIYGGDLAEEGQFPFIAHLLTTRGDGDYVCGSSILDVNTLVTAAHCVEDVLEITASAGTLNWERPGPNAQIRTSTPPNFAFHEDFVFNALTARNDIGYIKVAEPFDFDSEYVQGITIASSEPVPGDIVSAIGWGLTGDFGAPARELSYVENLEIVEDQIADDYFSNTFEHEDFICTYQTSGGTCGGDSGGPIVDANGNLVGAVSFGGQFCTSSPSCYTSLVVFKDWLRTNANVDV